MLTGAGNLPPYGPSNLGNNIYEADAITGSQILVLMGDILIDDAVAVTVQLGQNKVPVFGYGSPYYSFVADGQISVAGDLTIAFKESGYLLYPAKHYNNLIGKNQSATPRYGDSETALGERLVKSGDLRYLSNIARNKRILYTNVEQIMDLENDIHKGTAGETNKQHIQSMRDLAYLPDKDFENYAEAFEDVLWYGAEKANPAARDQLFSRNLPEGEHIDENDIFSHRRLDQYPPVDIWIIYGDPNHPAANHTVRKLLDVSFTGQVQAIEANGQIVYEKYQFISRNFV